MGNWKLKHAEKLLALPGVNRENLTSALHGERSKVSAEALGKHLKRLISLMDCKWSEEVQALCLSNEKILQKNNEQIRLTQMQSTTTKLLRRLQSTANNKPQKLDTLMNENCSSGELLCQQASTVIWVRWRSRWNSFAALLRLNEGCQRDGNWRAETMRLMMKTRWNWWRKIGSLPLWISLVKASI
jgi:hypothetical protein